MRIKPFYHLGMVASGLEEDLVVQLLPQNVVLHAPGKLRQTRTDQLLTSGNHRFLATQQILQLKFAWNLVNLFGWKFKICFDYGFLGIDACILTLVQLL
jgi:hypothetical protein